MHPLRVELYAERYQRQLDSLLQHDLDVITNERNRQFVAAADPKKIDQMAAKANVEQEKFIAKNKKNNIVTQKYNSRN